MATWDDTAVHALAQQDWSFAREETTHDGHGLHPYTGKFVPQIPKRLIDALTKPGERVADPFCGSGTTLVEGLGLGRHVVGVDQNPVAVCASRAKTEHFGAEQEAEIRSHLGRCMDGLDAMEGRNAGLFGKGETFRSEGWRPQGGHLDRWMDGHVVEELAELRVLWTGIEDPKARQLAQAVFSSIIRRVSRQDGEARYTRTAREVPEGATAKLYMERLARAARISAKWSRGKRGQCECRVIESDVRLEPDIGKVDLVVTSPPYPNAYDYHLYHKLRILWLAGDSEEVRRNEMGSHQGIRASMGPEEVGQAFRTEMQGVLEWLGRHLAEGRYCCVVVGDSIVKGERVRNAALLEEAGRAAGFHPVARWLRALPAHRKTLNPSIGKTKEEWIAVLRKGRG